MNYKNTFLFGVVIFTLFTISLTETIQISDALSAVSTKLIYELELGETQMLHWGIVNDISDTIELEFYATGEGSELLVFEEFVEVEPHKLQNFEIFVVIPDDHPDNVEYRPTLHALQRGFLEEGTSGMVINIQMKTIPIIKIGDNPIFTPPVKEIMSQPPPPIVKEVAPKIIEKTETLEEKLAKIQAANEQTGVNTQPETISEPETIPEPTSDYVPEPTSDPEPTVTTPIPVKAECGFVDWFLSLFGLTKC